MDVQAEAADVRLPEPARREARGRVRPATDDVERAAALVHRQPAQGQLALQRPLAVDEAPIGPHQSLGVLPGEGEVAQAREELERRGGDLGTDMLCVQHLGKPTKYGLY